MIPYSIYIVDDEETIRDGVTMALEGRYKVEAFKIAKGNESKAAKLLNIDHHTYRYRRKKLQIE